MIRYTLKEFLELFSESAHPEIQEILKMPHSKQKPKIIKQKLDDLQKRNETSGIEDKMPKGSSRAYVKESSQTPIHVDGQKTHMHTGYKISIRAPLDTHHDHVKYDGSLGQLQMREENGDHFVNQNYRVLTHKGNHHFKTNTESGIFPPLLDHDEHHDSWSHVAHVDNITSKNFREATKTDTHPKGISHMEFFTSLHRAWNKDNGKWWSQSPETEQHHDHIESHPLVQKFLDHQRNFAMPPNDYQQTGNMGIWTHPVTGKKHVVARDHGFTKLAQDAYHDARTTKYSKQKRNW
jgi:hypothetical protein